MFNNDSFCTASESQRGSLSGPVGDSAVHGVCFESIERLFGLLLLCACVCQHTRRLRRFNGSARLVFWQYM